VNSGVLISYIISLIHAPEIGSVESQINDTEEPRFAVLHLHNT